MEISVIAITRNGVEIARKLRGELDGCRAYAPAKLDDGGDGVEWFRESTAVKMGSAFAEGGALVCIFSLGAVIRLIAPHLRSKKTDPAVIVIDDRASFVISVLSGHLGGANRLAEEIAGRLGATAVVTTAADVNRTIPVDMVGRDLGWRIEDDSAVTRVSAMMVNEERIGVFQDAGRRDWWSGPLPGNVTRYGSMGELAGSDTRGHLIISDRELGPDLPDSSVVYRPKSLVVGVGLHRGTTREKIGSGVRDALKSAGLHPGCVAKLATVKKRADAEGLEEFGRESGIAIEYVDRDELARIRTPNPSAIVDAFEGTPSVSEAAAMLVSGGSLVVEKQKFPPDLTVAVARMEG